MDGLIALFSLASILALIAGLVMFLPIEKFKPKRILARRLLISGAIGFAIAMVIVPTRPSYKAQQAAAAESPAPVATSDPTPTPSPTADPSPAPPLVTHNYQQKIGDVYYYTGETEPGEGAAKVHGFKYVGELYQKGQFMVWAVNGMGMPLYDASCANPCSIIHLSTGEMLAYDPDSVIGAVFQDVMNGQLERLPVKISHPESRFYYGKVKPTSIYSPGSAAPDVDSSASQP